MPSKKPQKQDTTPADFSQQPLHLALLTQALEAYTSWLNGLADVGRDQIKVGSKLVAEVAEIHQQHFAKASARLTELLVVHTKLSTLWVERQLVTKKSGAWPPKGMPADYERLMKRQTETITELRSAYGLPPGTAKPRRNED